jgi:hypothetical protein
VNGPNYSAEVARLHDLMLEPPELPDEDEEIYEPDPDADYDAWKDRQTGAV